MDGCMSEEVCMGEDVCGWLYVRICVRMCVSVLESVCMCVR